MGDVRHVQIQVTDDDRERLLALVRALLEERLVACGQVLGPITSQYRWEGAVETAEEWLALLKTPAGRAGAVVEAVRARHAYEVPEILVLPVAGGLPAYLDWLDASTAAEK